MGRLNPLDDLARLSPRKSMIGNGGVKGTYIPGTFCNSQTGDLGREERAKSIHKKIRDKWALPSSSDDRRGQRGKRVVVPLSFFLRFCGRKQIGAPELLVSSLGGEDCIVQVVSILHRCALLGRLLRFVKKYEHGLCRCQTRGLACCNFAICIFFSRLPLSLGAVLLAGIVGSGGAGGFLRVTAIIEWAGSIRGMCVRNVDRLRSMYMASVGPISPIARPDRPRMPPTYDAGEDRPGS